MKPGIWFMSYFVFIGNAEGVYATAIMIVLTNVLIHAGEDAPLTARNM